MWSLRTVAGLVGRRRGMTSAQLYYILEKRILSSISGDQRQVCSHLTLYDIISISFIRRSVYHLQSRYITRSVRNGHHCPPLCRWYRGGHGAADRGRTGALFTVRDFRSLQSNGIVYTLLEAFNRMKFNDFRKISCLPQFTPPSSCDIQRRYGFGYIGVNQVRIQAFCEVLP